jgi:hypothetical protein
LGITKFRNITKEDIQAKGRLVPKGARHFAERANAVQTLSAAAASPIYQDPEVRMHISSVELAEKFVQTLDIDQENELVKPYVRLMEQAEAQKTIQAGQKQVVENASIVPELEEDEG